MTVIFILPFLLLAPLPALVLSWKIARNDFLETIFNVHISLLLALTGEKLNYYYTIFYSHSGIACLVEIITVSALLLEPKSSALNFLGCGLVIYLSWVWENAIQFGLTVSLIFRLLSSLYFTWSLNIIYDRYVLVKYGHRGILLKDGVGLKLFNLLYVFLNAFLLFLSHANLIGMTYRRDWISESKRLEFPEGNHALI